MIDPAHESGGIPVPGPVPVVTHRPVVLTVPDRPLDLSVSVSFPATGTALPVIVFSHGHGPSMFTGSMYGYTPLVEFLAAHGFAVVVPNHLDANFLGRREHASDPLFLRERATDIARVLDRLPEIEAAVPGLSGRLDHLRVAAVGHSAGGNTVGAVSGMTNVDPGDGTRWGAVEPRLSARVLLAAPGRGADMDGPAAGPYAALAGTDFTTMTVPALIVTGENDAHPFFASRTSWRRDAYTDSPAPKTNLILRGAEHMLGGISGFDVSETSDEDPHRVAVLRAMIWAYLRSTLYPADPAWASASEALTASLSDVARIEEKHEGRVPVAGT